MNINGAKIYFTIPILGGIPVTQTALSSFVVMLLLCIVGYRLGRNLKKRPGPSQVLTEKAVSMLYRLVSETMGSHNAHWAPYIGTVFLSSLLGSLIGMTGVLRSTTADLSTTLTWALMTSVLIWYHSIKNNGFLGWLKGFTEPIVVMTPMNIVSEIAQPISMAFRHFGNIVSGTVISTLVYAALVVANHALFSIIPGVVGQWLGAIPFLTVGIPAIISLYFDWFGSFMQAFIFCMLTMMFISTAAE